MGRGNKIRAQQSRLQKEQERRDAIQARFDRAKRIGFKQYSNVNHDPFGAYNALLYPYERTVRVKCNGRGRITYLGTWRHEMEVQWSPDHPPLLQRRSVVSEPSIQDQESYSFEELEEIWKKHVAEREAHYRTLASQLVRGDTIVLDTLPEINEVLKFMPPDDHLMGCMCIETIANNRVAFRWDKSKQSDRSAVVMGGPSTFDLYQRAMNTTRLNPHELLAVAGATPEQAKELKDKFEETYPAAKEFYGLDTETWAKDAPAEFKDWDALPNYSRADVEATQKRIAEDQKLRELDAGKLLRTTTTATRTIEIPVTEESLKMAAEYTAELEESHRRYREQLKPAPNFGLDYTGAPLGGPTYEGVDLAIGPDRTVVIQKSQATGKTETIAESDCSGQKHDRIVEGDE